MALDFLAGCLGGCAGVMVGHPLDTVKVHLQTQDARRPMYKGTFHCIKTIVARDSVRGLYRGMSSPMAGVAFVNAIVFGVYGNVQRNTNDPNSLRSHFLAGAAAGLVQSLVCSPMELVKTRLQLQENFPTAVKHQGPFHCLKYILKTQGVKGAFRGLGITAARDVPGFSSYFISYELMIKNHPNPSSFHTLMAGGLAGTFSWILTFPIDVIKSRLQADGMSGIPQYSGIIDCMRKTYAAEGLAFYRRGLASTLCRAFPTNAACFFVVSWTMKLADKVHLNVEIYQPEPLAVVGAMATPIMFPNHSHIYESHESQQKKSQLVKSLVFLGAFNEAVCSTEIAELANDLYNSEHYIYYNFDGVRQQQRLESNDDPFLFLT